MTPPSTGHAATILVVDDDPTILSLVAEILTDEGLVVHAFSDPRQALAHALAAPPDVVLTDLMLPHLDGAALLARLRHQPATRALPVVLLSAAPQGALGAPFTAVIAKPFTIDTLLAVLQRHLP